jgi:hypothetical protein
MLRSKDCTQGGISAFMQKFSNMPEISAYTGSMAKNSDFFPPEAIGKAIDNLFQSCLYHKKLINGKLHFFGSDCL